MAWLGTWAKRVQVTTDSGDVTANLTDFPVVIHLSSSCGKDSQDLTFVFDELGANDKKIAVTTNDGLTQLYAEIEEWDSGGEEAFIHSKFSAIASASDSYFYLYYDAGQADNNTYIGDPNSATAENVWDANFVFVSHMLDDPDTSNVRDSTQYDNDGAKLAANEPILSVNGIISSCQNFDGNNDLITVSDHATLDITDKITCEYWFNSPSLSTKANQGGILKGATTAYELRVTANASQPSFFINNNWINPALIYNQDNVWHHQVGTYDKDGGANNAKLFINFAGAVNLAAQETHVGAIATNALDLLLGVGGFAATKYIGLMDEVRISNVVRPVSWVTATYESGRDDFLSFGNEELIAPPVVGIYPPDSWKRQHISEDHLLQIQVRRPVFDVAIISADMRRLVSESLVIDASVRRQVRERLVASGRVYTTRELHDLMDDVITLLLLEQVDNIGG